jgi:organic hydroperoxide reductase OsmC/OhrA
MTRNASPRDRFKTTMAEYSSEILWKRGAQVFADNKYSRKHVWRFDGGVEINASSSPHVVPLPFSVADAVDPEEAFVASLSSCHMLWFLSIAAKRGFIVDEYRDPASGVMAENDAGKLAMTEIVLRPEVKFSGPLPPDAAQIYALHHAAHEECFIANSVKTEVRCEPKILPCIQRGFLTQRSKGGETPIRDRLFMICI